MEIDDIPNPEEALDNAIHQLEEKEDKLQSLSEKVSVMKLQLIEAKPLIAGLYRASKDDETFLGISVSGAYVLDSITKSVSQWETGLTTLNNDINNIGGTVNAFLSSTDSGVQMFPEVQRVYSFTSNHLLDQVDDISGRLETINSDLGKTHRGAWEVYNSSNTDKNRMALFQMRQTYDHFFAILAPDAKVRESEFWVEKTGDKPTQVYKDERLQYAAKEHIKNKEDAERLIAEANHIKQSYDLLNKGHKRGQISSEYTQQALESMDRILEQWLDAIGV